MTRDLPNHEPDAIARGWGCEIASRIYGCDPDEFLDRLTEALRQELPGLSRRRLLEEAERSRARVAEMIREGKIPTKLLTASASGVLTKKELADFGIDGEDIKPFVPLATLASRRHHATA